MLAAAKYIGAGLACSWLILVISIIPILDLLSNNFIYQNVNPSHIKHGITYATIVTFGTSTAYAIYANNQSTAATNEIRNDLYKNREEYKKVMKELKEVKREVKDLNSAVNTLSNTINNSISNTKKIISNFNFNLSSIKDYFSNVFNFGLSFELFNQLALYNCLCSMFLLSLFTNFLLGKYGNYLIDRFQLENKYPKLKKYLKYRSQIQQYYFKYLSFLAISTLIFNLAINSYAFFS